MSFDFVVHFGVNSSAGNNFWELETRGVNEFGQAPDFRGAVHGPGPIDASDTAPMEVLTMFDVPGLREHMVDSGCGDVQISNDAGTFVCNYTLYTSLRKGQTNALFVHIPAFENMGPDTQFHYMVNLLACIASASACNETPGQNS